MCTLFCSDILFEQNKQKTYFQMDLVSWPRPKVPLVSVSVGLVRNTPKQSRFYPPEEPKHVNWFVPGGLNGFDFP